jgi:hypothetical protein
MNFNPDLFVWVYSPIRHPKIPTMGNELIVGFHTMHDAQLFIKLVGEDTYPWFVPIISITRKLGKIIACKGDYIFEDDYISLEHLEQIKNKATLLSL